MRLLALLGALALCATARGQAIAPELLKPENRSVSSSKQFTVFGGSREQRSDLNRQAEEIKVTVLRELNLSDNWKATILLILTPSDGLRLRQPRLFAQVFDAGDAGRKLQVDISPAALGDEQTVRTGILKALLLEIALRRQQFTGSRFVDPPSWLVAAMSACLAKREPGEEARIYSALLESKGMPRLDRFLQQDADSLRGRSREVYEAQGLAFYQSLLQMPEGRGKVVDNLKLSEPSRDPVDRFAQTWPELVAEPDRLARQWALGIAKLSSPQRVAFFTADETSKKLAACLRSLDSGEGSESGVDAFVVLSRAPEGRFRLEEGASKLRQLGFRAHPLYIALVEEYRSMLDNLGRGKRRGFEPKFLEVEDLRSALDARCSEITDFLNWYQANAPADAFASPARPRPHPLASSRNDGISRYLDSVEERGW